MTNDALLHPVLPRKVTWCTPNHILDAVREVFGGPIELDPCSNPENSTQALTCYYPPVDGLLMPWAGKIFVNPPFGRGIESWLKKCYEAYMVGSELISLIPASVDTRHWQKYASTASSVCFLRGRVRFVGAPACAPFSTAILAWTKIPSRFVSVFRTLGVCYTTVDTTPWKTS